MPNFAERLLARATARDRAAAIMGDLEELAQTRGRRWFWAAYLRTLVSLGWRTPVAFLVAYTVSSWVELGAFPTIHGLLRSLYTSPLHKPRATTWHVGVRMAHATGFHFWQIPLSESLVALWFLLPFILIRFGFRDRLSRLASVLFLLTLPFFSLNPAGRSLAGFAAAAIFLTAMCLRNWRRPMIVLLASIAPVAVAIFAFGKVLAVLMSRGHSVFGPQVQGFLALARAAEVCAAAVACSLLYSQLLPDRNSVSATRDGRPA